MPIQIILCGLIILAVAGIIALFLGHRAEGAKRHSRVALAAEPDSDERFSFDDGYTPLNQLTPVEEWQSPYSLGAALGSEGRSTIRSLMGPTWVKGMRGPRGRIINESQFNALREDEKEYYRRKHDAKVEAQALKDWGLD